MIECPHCDLVQATQTAIDSHVADIHKQGGDDLVQATVVDKDANKREIAVSGLVITTTIGKNIVDDDHTVVAHASLTKYVKLELYLDRATEAWELVVFERLEGENYGDTPEGKVWNLTLGEWSVVANGTELAVI